jgi:hypothetical protein
MIDVFKIMNRAEYTNFMFTSHHSGPIKKMNFQTKAIKMSFF